MLKVECRARQRPLIKVTAIKELQCIKNTQKLSDVSLLSISPSFGRLERGEWAESVKATFKELAVLPLDAVW